MKGLVLRKWFEVGFYWISKKTTGKGLKYALRWRNKFLLSSLEKQGYKGAKSCRSDKTNQQFKLKNELLQINYLKQICPSYKPSRVKNTVQEIPPRTIKQKQHHSQILAQNNKNLINTASEHRPLNLQHSKNNERDLLKWLDQACKNIETKRQQKYPIAHQYQRTNTFSFLTKQEEFEINNQHTPHHAEEQKTFSDISLSNSLNVTPFKNISKQYLIETPQTFQHQKPAPLTKQKIDQRTKEIHHLIDYYKNMKQFRKKLIILKKNGEFYNKTQLQRLEKQMKQKKPQVQRALIQIEQMKKKNG